MKSSLGLLVLLVSGLAVASPADGLLNSPCESSAINAVKAHVVTTGDRCCFPWLGQWLAFEFWSRVGEHESSRMGAGSLLWRWLNQVSEIGIKRRSTVIRCDVLPVHPSASAEPARLLAASYAAYPIASGLESAADLHGPMVSLPARTQARRRNQQLNPNKTRQT